MRESTYFMTGKQLKLKSIFLLECPLYEDDRATLLETCEVEIKHFETLGLENKFIIIMKIKEAKGLSINVNIFMSVQSIHFQRPPPP